jgi:hypothetical protein
LFASFVRTWSAPVSGESPELEAIRSLKSDGMVSDR